MTALSEVVVGKGAPVGWKQLSSGKGLDIAKPDPAAVDFNDMAVGLSLICRFTGAMRNPRTFYSVAQHSILVSFLLPDRLAVYGLLHDGHEYILGDDSTPKKNVLATLAPEAATALKELKKGWDRAIWKAAALVAPSAADLEAIKQADHQALSIERRDLLAPPADDVTRRAWDWLPPPPAGVKVLPCLPAKACDWFLTLLGQHLWRGLPAGRA